MAEEMGMCLGGPMDGTVFPRSSLKVVWPVAPTPNASIEPTTVADLAIETVTYRSTHHFDRHGQRIFRLV